MRRAVYCSFVIISGLVLLLFGVLVVLFFKGWIDNFIMQEIPLREGSKPFQWWKAPPVTPMMKVYIFNFTNPEEFLTEGAKPIVNEVGPYVYREKWDKVNITWYENGTLSFQQKKIFEFDPELSSGSTEDVITVPNVPMLSATSQTRFAPRFIRRAISSILDILKMTPFTNVTVNELLWGYDDPLLKLAKDVMPSGAKLPYEQFGLLYGKNGTSEDVVTVYSGVNDIEKFNVIDRYNGEPHLAHWKTDKCNLLNGTDGSLFPPMITKNTTLYVYNKDLCRLLPLVYKEDVEAKGGVPGFRFGPPDNVFDDPAHNPDNECFCLGGPPCADNGLFNVSVCQYDTPIMLSFPHFMLGDPKLRDAVVGLKPDPAKHSFYMDVQPKMGTALRAKARVQINLAIYKVKDIPQVEAFPEMILPIMWFEEGIDSLAPEILDLLWAATTIPDMARIGLSYTLFAIGGVILLASIICLFRNNSRKEKITLETGKTIKQNNIALNGHNKGTDTKHMKDGLNPAFTESSESAVAT